MNRGPCWLSVSLAQVPAHDAWVGPREAQVLARIGVAKRRRDWRLGRFAAKEGLRRWLLAAAQPACDPEEIEILAAADGAPEVFLFGEALPVSLSISHSEGTALVVLGGPQTALGCDVEQVSARSARFVSDYFAPEEGAWVARHEHEALAVTLIWSAKESALKALRAGLTRDTREVVVEIDDAAVAGEWSALKVRDVAQGGAPLRGWWRAVGSAVETMVATGSLPHPSTTDARDLPAPG